MIYNEKINQTLMFGILQEDGTILAEDGKIEDFSIKSWDDEGNLEICIDSKEIDGQGSWHRRTFKHLVGMTVSYIVNGKREEGYKGFNHTILKSEN